MSIYQHHKIVRNIEGDGYLSLILELPLEPQPVSCCDLDLVSDLLEYRGIYEHDGLDGVSGNSQFSWHDPLHSYAAHAPSAHIMTFHRSSQAKAENLTLEITGAVAECMLLCRNGER